MQLEMVKIFLFVLNLLKLILGQHNPWYSPGHTAMVHLFDWSFKDIGKECEDFLGPNSFGGVQVSPIQEHAMIHGRPWYERYQPVSYKIKSRSGNEQEFQEMVSKCNKANVRVYVDVILNHMASPNTSGYSDIVVGTAGSTCNPKTKEFPAVPYTAEDFHRDCEIEPGYYKSDAHGIRNCKIFGLPDLDHFKANVKHHQIDFLNKLVDFGVAGFRIGSAKHMWPIDCRNLYAKVKNLNTSFGFAENSRPFFYQEVMDMGGEAVSKIEYVGYGTVTEFMASYILANALKGRQPLSDLLKWGTKMGFLHSRDAFIFVDNTNTQRGDSAGGKTILNYKNRKLYIMANAFLLSHTYGHKRILSSFYFTDNDHGPPTNKDGTIRSPEFLETSNNQGQCRNESGWVCEHRWPSIVNIVKMVNFVKEEPVTRFGSSGPRNIHFCRGDKAFLIISNDPTKDFNQTVNTCLDEGVYCDVISGRMENNHCTGLEIRVRKDRTATIVIPKDNGVILIYKGALLKKD